VNRIRKHPKACVLCIFAFSLIIYSIFSTPLALAEDSVNLSPFQCGDGQFIITTIGGDTVWQNISGHIYFYFDVPESFTFTPGSPVYVKVTYYDEAYGTVGLEYDSTRGSTIPDIYYCSETHTRSSRVNSCTFVDSYHELLLPQFAGRQNGGADFRLNLADGEEVPNSVKSVTVQNFPFNDSEFQYILSKPWLSSYTGPTKDYVTRNSLNHKVMVGYQGWFRAPNDLADKGWIHWCRDGVMIPTNFTVDQWPDLTGFHTDELFKAADIETRNGQPAYVFSSTTRATIRRHFQWMRKYNIDGAFLQRFVHPDMSGAWGHNEWVLHHVREAANLEGRIWAIEYDVSSLENNPDAFEIITTDWKWLVDVVGILDDQRYAYEGDKPVVFIWGLPYPDKGFPKTTANAIVDYFKNDPDYGGNYVIGGFPWWWRTITDWYDHFQRYDGALAWMPGNQAGYTADYEMLSGWGIDYFPHVWPGFSWANLMKQSGNEDYWPRNGGTFFWQKIYEALGSGASRLFIGMFDEYDEGTAIMPMTDDPPNPPLDWGRFIDNDGRPSDWWMMLSGEAKETLLSYRPYSPVMPTEEELANRSNIGPEAWIDLETIDVNHLLYLRQPGDGQTSAGTYAGRNCRYNTTSGTDLYFYFDVAAAFAHQVSEGLDVTIEIEYYDRDGNIELSLEYDSVSRAYTLHPKIITTQGSGEWRTVRFNIADAYFGNRQNDGSDFRLRLVQNARVHVDRVWVSRETYNPIILVGKELAVDFSVNGLWHYDGSSWTSLASCNPDGIVDWTGGMAVDFDTYGVWNYDGTTWSQLAGWNPENIIAWNNGLSVDFGGNGLWSYDGSSWTSLASWDPDDGMVEWAGGMAVDFGVSYGLWNYTGTTWSQLAAWEAEYGIAWNSGLAVDFGSNGLWYYGGTSWTSLAGWNPDGMVDWTGGLAVDFDTYGTWNYDGTTWTQLAGWNPEDDMVSWTDGIAVDFGSNGLWSYDDGSSWTSLAGWNPEEMEAWANGLAVDFGAAYGLWNYDGSFWSNLAGWDSEDIIDVDLY